MQIKDSLALITGASTGIGAAIAKALALKGARTILLARTQTKLDQVAEEIRSRGGQAYAYAVDLGEAASVEKAFNALAAAAGTPDIVVNSAGAGRWLFTEETSAPEVVEMMNAPYFAAFYITRLCLPVMIQRGRGHIVNINSPAAFGGWPGAAGYTAARYALYGFTHALRVDLQGTGVHVTSIVPGKVKDSEYFIRHAGAAERAPKIAVLIPEVTTAQVARVTVRAIERNQREVILPFMLWVFRVLNHVAPRVVEWVIVQTGWRHKGR